MTYIPRMILFVASTMLLTACSDQTPEQTGLVSAEPAVSSTIQQAPSAVRLYFEFAPDSENSTLTLTGPDGSIPLMGQHTMGMNDLMVMVNHPPLQSGHYVVTWEVQSFQSKDHSNGEYSFDIEN